MVESEWEWDDATSLRSRWVIQLYSIVHTQENTTEFLVASLESRSWPWGWWSVGVWNCLSIVKSLIVPGGMMFRSHDNDGKEEAFDGSVSVIVSCLRRWILLQKKKIPTDLLNYQSARTYMINFFFQPSMNKYTLLLPSQRLLGRSHGFNGESQPQRLNITLNNYSFSQNIINYYWWSLRSTVMAVVPVACRAHWDAYW